MADEYLCTFAGVPFRMPDARLLKKLEDTNFLEDTRNALPYHSSWPGPALMRSGLPIPTPAPRPRINDYFYPTGASRWSCFRGVMTADDVAAVKEVVWPSDQQDADFGVFKMKQDIGVVPSVSFPTGSTHRTANGITTNLFMLPPTPIISEDDSTNHLYLVTLVDERYFWNLWNDAGVIDAGGGETWQDLIEDLCTRLGVTLSATTYPNFYYPETDSPLYSSYESAAAMLDLIAANCGRIVLRNMSGPTYSLGVVYNENAEYYDREDDGIESSTYGDPGARILGGLSYHASAISAVLQNNENYRAVLPRYVKVVFPKWINGAGYYQPNSRRGMYLNDSYGEVWTETFDLQTGNAVSGGYGSSFTYIDRTTILRTTAKARFTAASDPTPTNQASCQALTASLAAYFAIGQRLLYADMTFTGIYVPGYWHDLLFRWDPDSRKCFTRILGNPINSYVTDFHQSFESPSLDHPTASAPPSGAAGGDLAGTYPNPTVANISLSVFQAELTAAGGIDL